MSEITITAIGGIELTTVRAVFGYRNKSFILLDNNDCICDRVTKQSMSELTIAEVYQQKGKAPEAFQDDWALYTTEGMVDHAYAVDVIYKDGKPIYAFTRPTEKGRRYRIKVDRLGQPYNILLSLKKSGNVQELAFTMQAA